MNSTRGCSLTSITSSPRRNCAPEHEESGVDVGSLRLVFEFERLVVLFGPSADSELQSPVGMVVELQE